MSPRSGYNHPIEEKCRTDRFAISYHHLQPSCGEGFNLRTIIIVIIIIIIIIIHRTTNEDQCRLCRKATETIHHITSGCVAMAPTKYLQRHDNVCKYVHDLLLNEFNFKDMPTTWYLHKPRAVEENENAKILWNFSVQTDHAMQHKLSTRPRTRLTSSM